MLLPGPEAQQLATYLGWLLHGVRGGLAAGILFVLPGAFVMLGLSLLYALGRGVPLIDGALFGIKAAVLVIVVEALIRIGKRALKTSVLLGLAAAALSASSFSALPFPLIVAAAALVGYLVAQNHPQRMGLPAKAPPSVNPRRRRRPLAAFAIAGRPAGVVGAGGARRAGVRAAARAGSDRRVFLQARGRELRRRLCAARLHGAAGGGDLRLDDRAGNGGRARSRRNHAGTADPGDAVRRLPRGVPRGGAVFAGHRRRARRGHDDLGDFRAVDAVDLRRRALHRAAARNRQLSGALAAITAAVVGVILNLSVWFALHVLFGKLTEMHIGPLRWYAFDPLALDIRAAALAAIAAVLAFGLHRSLIEVIVSMAALGVVTQYVLG